MCVFVCAWYARATEQWESGGGRREITKVQQIDIPSEVPSKPTVFLCELCLFDVLSCVFVRRCCSFTPSPFPSLSPLHNFFIFAICIFRAAIQTTTFIFCQHSPGIRHLRPTSNCENDANIFSPTEFAPKIIGCSAHANAQSTSHTAMALTIIELSRQRYRHRDDGSS